MVGFKLQATSNQNKRINITALAGSTMSMHGNVNPTQQINNGVMTMCLSGLPASNISCDGATDRVIIFEDLVYEEDT